MTLVGGNAQDESSRKAPVGPGRLGAPQVHMLLKKFLCTVEVRSRGYCETWDSVDVLVLLCHLFFCP